MEKKIDSKYMPMGMKGSEQEAFIPEIAILEKNTLTALGLETILEELIPNAIIRVFPTFEKLIDDTPDMYAHYFVSAQIYFEHTSFFLERSPKAIVLTSGESPALSRVPHLNMCISQEKLIKSFMDLQTHGHQMKPHPHASKIQEPANDLTPREIDVLCLVSKGLANKEIADKLNIGLTTVISHRKNITEKLGIKSASGLAIFAVMHGYIEADSI